MNENCKVISCFNEKGGVGKSSILFHLAYLLHESGKKVLVIDLDTQGNMSTTLLGDEFQLDYETNLGVSQLLGMESNNEMTLENIANNKDGISVIFSDQALEHAEELSPQDIIDNMNENIADLKEYFDAILIDCPPSIGKRVDGALSVSTNVISPIEPRKFAIDRLGNVMDKITHFQNENEDLAFDGVIINRVNSRSRRQRENIGIIRDALGKKVFLSEVVEREAISDAVEIGVPVWRLGKSGSITQAKKEIMALLNELERSIF